MNELNKNLCECESKEESFMKNEENKQKHKKKQNKKNIFKRYFYITSIILFLSLFMLSAKIINIKFKLFSNNINKSLSLTLFIIYCNELLLSIIFIYTNQITFKNNFNTDEKFEYFFKISFEYIKTVLVFQSLQELSLIIFILIVSLHPVIITYLKIKKEMEANKKFDSIIVLFFLIICIYLFLHENKRCFIFALIYIIMYGISSISENNAGKNFHPYFIIIGSSIIGIFSSLIIIILYSIKINFSLEHILFSIIISICDFFYLYYRESFVKHHNLYEQKHIAISFIYIIICLFFSYFILDEEYCISTFILLISVLIINIYSKFRFLISENDEEL